MCPVQVYTLNVLAQYLAYLTPTASSSAAASSSKPATSSTAIAPTLTTLTTSTRPTTISSSSAPVASGTYSKPDGLKFNIDGVTKYYAGTNSYWIGFLTNNADVDTVLDHMVSSGLKILRVWGFNDVNTIPSAGTVYFQAFTGTTPTINTGANGLQRLDYVVSAAEKRGIKLIINFVNNWTDYGGMAAYMKFYGGTANPDWYASSAIQAQYKTYIKAVVSRYTTSKAIFAWELANEPRCNGCNTNVIYNWAASTSAYIKSLDPNHMVTMGDEGFGINVGSDGSYPYSYGEGSNFTMNLGIKTLDFGTFHLYPSSCQYLAILKHQQHQLMYHTGGTTNDWGNQWITSHGAACAAAGKPCLLEEYGITDATQKCAVEGKWQTTALATKGIAGDLFWDIGDTLSTGKTSDDGNTIFYGTSDWTCLVTNHVKAIG